MASSSLATVAQQTNEIQDNEEYDLRDQLLVGLMEKKFRKHLHKTLPEDPTKLCTKLQEYEEEINKLRKKGIIKIDQYNLLLPTNKTTVDSDDFDVTLLGVLIKNFCNMKKNSPEYKIIQDFLQNRNKVNHVSKLKITEQSFNQIYNSVEQPLLDLGATQSELDYVKNVRILDKQAKEKIKQIQESNIAFNYNYLPPIGNFHSRDKELQDLHRKLVNSKDPQNQKIGVVLSGFGGIGKSETCREYWRIFKASYENIVIWINCESSLSMESNFNEVASRCGLDGIRNADGTYKPIQEVVNLVYHHFSKQKDGHTNRKVLFIMDNLNEPNIIQDFLPRSSMVSPYILITSQCKDWDNRFDVFSLNVFSEEESIKFMKNNISGIAKDKCTIILVQNLGCHPLALQQAISYMKKNYTSVSDYLKLLKERQEEMLAKPPNEIGSSSVLTTLSLALTRLQEKQNQNSLLLLNIMAHLDGKDIQKGFLLNFVGNNLYELNNALETLQKYSFININRHEVSNAVSTQIVTIHSLTQSFSCIQQLNRGSFKTTIKTITAFFRTDLTKLINNNQTRLLNLWYHHFLHIYEKNEESRSNLIIEFSEHPLLLSEIYKNTGNYQKGHEIFKEIHALHSNQQKISESYLTSKYNEVVFLMMKGEYDNALTMFKEIEKVRLQTVGDQSESYLTTKHEIANCLLKKGEYDNALTLFKEIENVRLQTVGDQNESYLRTKHEIANCLLNKGEYDNALTMFKEIEKVRLQTVGDQSESYLTTKHNIAKCLLNKGEYDHALTMFKEIEKVELQTVGDQSESYLTTKHEIAKCLLNKGEYDNALTMFKEIEKVRLQTVGDQSESYLTTKHEIAKCLLNKGEYDNALTMFKEIEKVELQTVGDQSESYLTTKHEIAKCLLNKGEYDNALTMFKEIEKVRLQTVGDQSESYLTSKHEIANCLLNKGEYDNALTMFKEIEKVRLQTVGDQSESYLTTKHQIAKCLLDKGEYDNALTMFKEIENVRLQTVGDQSESYLTAKHNIAHCLLRQGYHNNALVIFREIETVVENNNLQNHPNILRTKHRIANCLEQMGKIEEAICLYKEVESLQLEKLGESHSHYLETLEDRESCEMVPRQKRKFEQCFLM